MFPFRFLDLGKMASDSNKTVKFELIVRKKHIYKNHAKMTKLKLRLPPLKWKKNRQKDIKYYPIIFPRLVNY